MYRALAISEGVDISKISSSESGCALLRPLIWPDGGIGVGDGDRP